VISDDGVIPANMLSTPGEDEPLYLKMRMRGVATWCSHARYSGGLPRGPWICPMIISWRGVLPPVMLVGSKMPVTVRLRACVSYSDHAASSTPSLTISRSSHRVAELPPVVSTSPLVGAIMTIRSWSSR
jgi:hypothetical protein